MLAPHSSFQPRDASRRVSSGRSQYSNPDPTWNPESRIPKTSSMINRAYNPWHVRCFFGTIASVEYNHRTKKYSTIGAMELKLAIRQAYLLILALALLLAHHVGDPRRWYEAKAHKDEHDHRERLRIRIFHSVRLCRNKPSTSRIPQQPKNTARKQRKRVIRQVPRSISGESMMHLGS